MSDTKKVVINKCYGGFSLSPVAVARLAELQGRPCYFFAHPRAGGSIDFDRLERVSIEDATKAFTWSAFDTPEAPTSPKGDEWAAMSLEERQAHNAAYAARSYDNRPDKRDDALLVRVVEELGEKANGSHAELVILEIPADVEFVIEEYDGSEWIAEAHRTWR